MVTEKQIELSWLLPDLTQLKLIPETGTELSSLFVVILWGITFLAAVLFLAKFFQTRARLKWLLRILENLKREDIANKRIDLLSEAKKRDKDIGFLWMEFDETLGKMRISPRCEIIAA